MHDAAGSFGPGFLAGFLGSGLVAVLLAAGVPAEADVGQLGADDCTWSCADCVRDARSIEDERACTAAAAGCCAAYGRQPPRGPGFCECGEPTR